MRTVRKWISRTTIRQSERRDRDVMFPISDLLTVYVTMAPKHILLAEDNPDDAFIFKIMFERARLPQKLHRVENGQQAIDWLKGFGEWKDRTRFPMPDLLLLDLKMPVKNGFEVLEWLRSENGSVKVPVAVLSSSDDSRDLKRANELGVTRYFIKSPRLEDVIAYLRSIL